MSPVGQVDILDVRADIGVFLMGLGFTRDASGSAGRRPGRFVIEKAGHGPVLCVSADVQNTFTTVLEVARPEWAEAPGGGERWLRELARDLGGKHVHWSPDGRRARVEVPSIRCVRFLRAWVLQEFGWAWHAMARVARKED